MKACRNCQYFAALPETEATETNPPGHCMALDKTTHEFEGMDCESHSPLAERQPLLPDDGSIYESEPVKLFVWKDVVMVVMALTVAALLVWLRLHMGGGK